MVDFRSGSQYMHVIHLTGWRKNCRTRDDFNQIHFVCIYRSNVHRQRHWVVVVRHFETTDKTSFQSPTIQSAATKSILVGLHSRKTILSTVCRGHLYQVIKTWFYCCCCCCVSAAIQAFSCRHGMLVVAVLFCCLYNRNTHTHKVVKSCLRDTIYSIRRCFPQQPNEKKHIEHSKFVTLHTFQCSFIRVARRGCTLFCIGRSLIWMNLLSDRLSSVKTATNANGANETRKRKWAKDTRCVSAIK